MFFDGLFFFVFFFSVLPILIILQELTTSTASVKCCGKPGMPVMSLLSVSLRVYKYLFWVSTQINPQKKNMQNAQIKYLKLFATACVQLVNMSEFKRLQDFHFFPFNFGCVTSQKGVLVVNLSESYCKKCSNSFDLKLKQCPVKMTWLRKYIKTAICMVELR